MIRPSAWVCQGAVAMAGVILVALASLHAVFTPHPGRMTVVAVGALAVLALATFQRNLRTHAIVWCLLAILFVAALFGWSASVTRDNPVTWSGLRNVQTPSSPPAGFKIEKVLNLELPLPVAEPFKKDQTTVSFRLPNKTGAIVVHSSGYIEGLSQARIVTGDRSDYDLNRRFWRSKGVFFGLVRQLAVMQKVRVEEWSAPGWRGFFAHEAATAGRQTHERLDFALFDVDSGRTAQVTWALGPGSPVDAASVHQAMAAARFVKPAE